MKKKFDLEKMRVRASETNKYASYIEKLVDLNYRIKMKILDFRVAHEENNEELKQKILLEIDKLNIEKEDITGKIGCRATVQL